MKMIQFLIEFPFQLKEASSTFREADTRNSGREPPGVDLHEFMVLSLEQAPCVNTRWFPPAVTREKVHKVVKFF
jgi:hypothetical protein